jgi:mono/diheme cytochrome c family protein
MTVTMKTLIRLAGVATLCASGVLVTALTGATSAPADDLKFDAATIAKGAELAAIGNCGTCHTAEGGKPFAGGRPLSAPFGTIYSTNITPEPDTGIGKWTEAEFVRAMHDGVDREGHDLYPAFPYDHFTKVSDEDVKAIYAFVMTRDPVRAQRPRNDLTFPANFRTSLRAWKALYFRAGRFEPDSTKSTQWNRGAYLAEGLGHCGACHTPRNALGAEKLSDAYGGGEAERWLAPAMNEASPAPVPWTADDVFNYLRYGFDARHGIAAGPMVDVVRNLARVPEADVRAIAVYMADLMRRPMREANPNDERNAFAELQESAAVPGTGRDAVTTRSSGAAAFDTGATVFEGACATCHYSGSGLQSTKPVPLALTTSVNAPDPRNLIHIVQNGLWPASGERGAMMPGFAAELTDDQLVAVVSYVRERFSRQPAWHDVVAQVQAIRAAGLSQGANYAPSGGSAAAKPQARGF